MLLDHNSINFFFNWQPCNVLNEKIRRFIGKNKLGNHHTKKIILSAHVPNQPFYPKI